MAKDALYWLTDEERARLHDANVGAPVGGELQTERAMRALRAWMTMFGFAPTSRELAAVMRISNQSAVNVLLALENAGRIQRSGAANRKTVLIE